MANRPSLDDYVDVAERIAAFKAAHPEGSLQTISWEVKEIGDRTFVVYNAAAYRNPDDTRPGHGIAWEPFPGPTPYTRDSELMNAETAAWGRAIVAVGIAANRKIASRQEVKARPAQGDGQAHVETAAATLDAVEVATPADVEKLRKAAHGLTNRKLKLAFSAVGLDAAQVAFEDVPRDKVVDLCLKLENTAR